MLNYCHMYQGLNVWRLKRDQLLTLRIIAVAIPNYSQFLVTLIRHMWQSLWLGLVNLHSTLLLGCLSLLQRLES